jgi:hypothetical protein
MIVSSLGRATVPHEAQSLERLPASAQPDGVVNSVRLARIILISILIPFSPIVLLKIRLIAGTGK